MMKAYDGAVNTAANVVAAGAGAVNAFKNSASVGKGILNGAQAAGKTMLFGSSSIEFDKMVGAQAMQRVQAQTEAKIPKSIDPDGGKDGSETT